MPAPNQCTTSSSGVTTTTMPAVPSKTWNLTYLSVSMAGPTSGVNAKVTVWDGAVGTGTPILVAYLNGPGAVGTGIGSVGTIQEVPIPKDARGQPALQSTPGNAMNVQVVGTGANQVALNTRITDGLS